MTYTEIRYEVDGDVGILTLNRPEARNALTYTTYAELEDAVRTTSARCLVITGADPAFCSGDDVKQIMVQAGERALRVCGRNPGLLLRPMPFSAPTCPSSPRSTAPPSAGAWSWR